MNGPLPLRSHALWAMAALDFRDEDNGDATKNKKKTGPQKTDGALELKRSKWGQNPSFHLAQERLPKYRFSSQVPDNLHYFGVILRFHRYIYIYIISGAPMTVNPFCWRFRLQRAKPKKDATGTLRPTPWAGGSARVCRWRHCQMSHTTRHGRLLLLC